MNRTKRIIVQNISKLTTTACFIQGENIDIDIDIAHNQQKNLEYTFRSTRTKQQPYKNETQFT